MINKKSNYNRDDKTLRSERVERCLQWCQCNNASTETLIGSNRERTYLRSITKTISKINQNDYLVISEAGWKLID